MLIFQLLYNGVYCQKIHNISRNIWTSGVECGKICIGEQPRLYKWRSEGFGPVRGDEYGYF